MTRDQALLQLLAALKARDYRFVVVTPATHERVIARTQTHAGELRDLLGWNREAQLDALEPEIRQLLQAADAFEPADDGIRSRIRVASLGSDLFLHSQFPTDDPDAVFFGPDTYRFARFIADRWPNTAPRHIVDLGTGSGAGGIAAARLAPDAKLTLLDTNAAALELAAINAAAAGVEAQVLAGSAIPDGADMVLANPPYMMDADQRTYRDGGDLLGGQVALDWTQQALAKLAPGGTLLLYTGAAVVGGDAPLVSALETACREAGAACRIEELDPDVFGEELALPNYAEVERIAAIGVTVRTAG